MRWAYSATSATLKKDADPRQQFCAPISLPRNHRRIRMCSNARRYEIREVSTLNMHRFSLIALVDFAFVKANVIVQQHSG